jgi:glycosyltransferase involved in cell wall biosynthesis
VSAEPFVSVAVSTFNYGRYIGECLDAIVGQDYPADRFEIVVIDDGSTDDTKARVERFGERVRYEYQDNTGLIATMNRLLGLCRGEFVLTIDPDDVWEPGKIRAVVDRFLAEPDAAVVSHPSLVIDEAGKPLAGRRGEAPYARFTAEDLAREPAQLAHQSGLAYRRSVLEKILPIPGTRRFANPDLYLVHAALEHGAATFLKEPLNRYRQHAASWSDRLGTMNRDPHQLRVGQESWKVVETAIRVCLRRKGLERRWSESVMADRRRSRMERLVLLCAYSGRPARGRRLLAAMPASWRKRAALRLALASPPLFRALHYAFFGVAARAFSSLAGSR